MFTVNHQPPRCHDLFLRGRPYRGEPPTVAGFLLYPDTPAKMETTSREAFCFKVVPQQVRGKAPGNYITENTLQESHCHHPSSSSSRDSRTDGERGQTAVSHEPDTAQMQSQYQKDFPPPSCCRRRTPVIPPPDNIGINPAFRIDFHTVQREAFPGWSPVKPQA
nr:uncharacterized protein si:dkeyp-69c1.9 [Solea senegalensis]XP_043898533.1 uncharacterized protein si:dkeyp-69c1.9 [Solea senegalensis]XP_043898534.1 uncharacterized protein si:dkeyp-69c1.9 [Solea senegalensis]